nr:extracellular solute-binding protein [Dehalococcoidales bacterium]
KDIFAAQSIDVPETMGEMEEVAKKLTDKGKNQFGVLWRGQAGPAVGVWSAFQANFGADWLTPDGKPTANNPDVVRSIEHYGRLLREYGPPGALNINWPQAVDLFAQGSSMQFCESSALLARWEDPKTSKVVDKTGYALLPGEKGGQNPALNGWIWSIYAKSKKKEPAWYFVQWASGKDVSARMQRKGIQQGRQSSWNDAEFQKEFGAKHPDLVETMLKSYEKGKAFLYPPYVNVAKARDIYGEAISVAIQGGDVAAACEKAQKALEDLQAAEG